MSPVAPPKRTTLVLLTIVMVWPKRACGMSPLTSTSSTIYPSGFDFSPKVTVGVATSPIPPISMSLTLSACISLTWIGPPPRVTDMFCWTPFVPAWALVWAPSEGEAVAEGVFFTDYFIL